MPRDRGIAGRYEQETQRCQAPFVLRISSSGRSRWPEPLPEPDSACGPRRATPSRCTLLLQLGIVYPPFLSRVRVLGPEPCTASHLVRAGPGQVQPSRCRGDLPISFSLVVHKL